MSITLRTDVFSYQPFPKQIPKFDPNQLINLEQKVEILFISKMPVQKQNTLLCTKQKVINKIYKTISIKEPPRRFEVSRRTLHKWRCTPRKIVNGIVINKIDKKLRREHKKYTLEFKQKAVSMVCLGSCINQVSKKLVISYNALKNWMKRASAPNCIYNSSEAWLYKKHSNPT